MTRKQKPESAEFRTRAMEELCAAQDFHDRVVSSSPDEQIAVGQDHHTRLERAVRAVIAEARGAAERDTYQSRVDDWMAACFGTEISADRMERNHRFLEEAIELVQSTGCTQSEAHQLVDYVYGRPVGDPVQEVGGVMVTLAALSSAHAITLKDAAETELARIWTKVEKIRAMQAAKPKHSPLPEHVAEQCRKDAKGVEPVGYIAEDTPAFFAKCGVVTVSTGMLSHPNGRENVPVYTQPPNVAALEARVKELEGEVARLQKPEFYAVSDLEDSWLSTEELMDSLDGDIPHFETVEIDCFRRVSRIWAFYDGKKVREFAHKEEAKVAAAAAIREGGE